MTALVDRARAAAGLPPRPPRGERVQDAMSLDVTLGRTVPTIGLRILPAALVALVAVLAGAGPTVLLAGLVLAALAAWRPALPVAAWLTAVVGLWLLASGDPLAPAAGADLTGADASGYARVAALVLLLHLLSAAAGLAAHVPWHGLVEVRALARVGLRLLAAQVPVQLLLGLLWWWRTMADPLGSDVLRAVAVLAAFGVVLLVLPRRDGARRTWLRG